MKREITRKITSKSMLCPITKTLMLDPVIASDGHTYERKAIQDLINSGGVSPFDEQPLKPELTPDTELQKAITQKIALELNEILQGNPQIAEKLPRMTGSPLDVKTRYSSLEHLPNEILFIIARHVGKDGLTLSQGKQLAEGGNKALFRFFRRVIKAANAEFIAFLGPILRLDPNVVKAKLEERPDLLPREEVELTKLLIHVVKAEITEAEAMLTDNPNLLLAKGRVIDFSGRTFFGKGITAFQYALAAQDMQMTKMLLKHFPSSEEGEAAVAWQYAELGEMLADKDENKHRALKNLNHSIDDLHKTLGAYIEKYKNTKFNEFSEHFKEVDEANWFDVVGVRQRKLPAWVIVMMCERRADKNTELHWVQKREHFHYDHDIKYSISNHLIWWIDDVTVVAPSPESYDIDVTVRDSGKGLKGIIKRWNELRSGSVADHEVLAQCQSARPGELPTLESLWSGDDLASIDSPSKGSKQRKK